METHYPEQISLDDLAASACLSRYHFTRLFKRTYGRTPFQVLSDIRVREAKRLLKKGIPVRNVCWAVGFESVQSFSHLFKRLTGKTPSAFLNKSNIR
ncbi:MAG: AraC family transcriptional regulator [Saprospiraceae bacterium]